MTAEESRGRKYRVTRRGAGWSPRGRHGCLWRENTSPEKRRRRQKDTRHTSRVSRAIASWIKSMANCFVNQLFYNWMRLHHSLHLFLLHLFVAFFGDRTRFVGGGKAGIVLSVLTSKPWSLWTVTRLRFSLFVLYATACSAFFQIASSRFSDSEFSVFNVARLARKRGILYIH